MNIKWKRKLKAAWVYDRTLFVVAAKKMGKKDVDALARLLGVKKVVSMETSEFFRKIMEFDMKLIISIRDGKIEHDPLDLVRVVEKNTKKGLMMGTKEMFMSKFQFIEKNIRELEEVNDKVFNNIYAACVEAAQSALTETGQTILIPRRIPELLRVHLLGKGLDRLHASYCKEIIETYKAVEHGQTGRPIGKKLDDLSRKCEIFREAVASKK